MVNEYKNGEVTLNSTSLEDVAQRETSEDRAQSITSIHTAASEANTPTYEELQSKLEASSRNMQHIKDQQHQLIRMQQAAKQHLNEMENIRSQQKKPPHFNQNGSAPPDYESVEQVHDDMNSLVNRMKSLTTFIQNQNELSALLGEDGPDVLAEQIALQKKLEDLKAKKQDMQNLISELQEINCSAEHSLQNQQQSEPAARVVPVEYQRVVPIELIGSSKQSQSGKKETLGHYNGLENGISEENHVDVSEELVGEDVVTDEDAEVLGESELIRQKSANIDAMKRQLKRLKDMMETVKLIEEKSEGKSASEIADEAEANARVPECHVQRESLQNLQKSGDMVSNDTEQPAALAEKYEPPVRNSEEDEMAERVRVLHEMKLFVQDQVSHLAAERDRIKSIKNEMKKRRDESVHKIPNHEDSPSRIQNSSQSSKDSEKHLLKVEYETKKKEFEKLCQRLENEQEVNRDDTNGAREAITRHVDHVKHDSENVLYYSDNWDRDHVVSSSSSIQGGKAAPLTPIRGKESADSGAADIHGVASLEARSYQSGCSSGFSARPFNTRGTDNPQFQFDNFTAPRMPPPPSSWNANYYYSTPYSQQFSPHCHHPMPQNIGNNEFFCTQQCHANIISANTNTGNSQQAINPQNPCGISSDPVLLQQFIQTQQMLINSVCQCNQLLWLQQKEINNLNKAVLSLQERLKIPTESDSGSLPENRNGSNQQSNNLYTGNRAQSEPRHPAPLSSQHYQSMQAPLSPIRQFHSYNYNNIYHHQRRNISNLQHAHHLLSTNSYNFAHTDPNNLCPQLAAQGQQAMPFNNSTPNFLNNDVPQSGNQQNSAQPIFMHHHNNTITPSGTNVPSNSTLHTNNNSNVLNLQQNCLNSPSATVPPAALNATLVSNSNNAAAAAAALNNQVPPGNRANNYWDNFRSYSRQNLLSSNSCKSNEEQNQHQLSTSPFGVNMNTSNASGGRNNHFNPTRNFQHLNVANIGNSSSNSSNLAPSTYDTKYLHTFRNQIGNTTACLPQHQTAGPIASSSENEQSTLIHSLTSDNNIDHNQSTHTCEGNLQISNSMINQLESANVNTDIFNFNNNNINNNASLATNYNNVSSTIFGSPDFRNMNFNFEVNELKKKLPFKTPCNTKRLKQTSGSHQEANYANQNLITEPGANIAPQNTNIDQSVLQQSVNQRSQIDDDNDSLIAQDDNEAAANELKRNLLVNALKNDKFTAKFFESLKEDVYREVYAIIQATESHPHYLIQLFKELQLVSTADPLRNIVMQAMHDLYKRSCANSSSNNSSEADSKIGVENAEQNSTVSIQSSSINNRDVKVEKNPDDSKSSTCESNHDNEIMNSLLNSQELRRLAYKIMFESSSPTRPGKGGKKTGVRCDMLSPTGTTKTQNEIFRPDYELINLIMEAIQNTITAQIIDDTSIIRIAKLTCSSVESLSPAITNTSQNDRILLSPKSLYRVMKSFENRDRDSFLAQYEAYLNNLFVIKISNDDINNINLANKKSRDENSSGSGNTLLLTNDDMQNLKRHAQTCKSNIPIINPIDLGMDIYGARKVVRDEDSANSGNVNTINLANPICNYSNPPEPNNNASSSQPPDLITTADVAMVFGSSNIASYTNNDQQGTSPCNNNNIMNEDLAEADQICSSNNTVTSSTVHRERCTTEPEITSSLAEDYISERRTKSSGNENNNEISDLNKLFQNHEANSAVNLKAEEDTFDTVEKNPLLFNSFASRSGPDSSEEMCENVSDIPLSVTNDASCIFLLQSSADSTINHSFNNVGNETGGSNNYVAPPKQKSIP